MRKAFAIYVNVINIDMSRTQKEEQAAMYAVVTRIDDFGRPAWIALMVLGFIVFWPIGLAILAYMLWSGRMACGRYGDVDQWRRGRIGSSGRRERWERKRERWERKMQHWAGHRGHGLRPSGNYAFDEYREEALRRLEEEANEFREFLDRLRAAKDRAEFDEFMRDRRNRPGGSGSGSQEPGAEAAGLTREAASSQRKDRRPVLSDRPLLLRGRRQSVAIADGRASADGRYLKPPPRWPGRTPNADARQGPLATLIGAA